MDGSYSSEELLKAERCILNVLEFEVSGVQPYHVIRRISRADQYASGPRTLSKYLLEITLLDERFLAWTVSKVSAGCMMFALLLMNGSWVFYF